jgi:enoyl-CoA hydratase
MPVDAERRGRILIITLRREEKRNALDPSITAGLDAALNELDDDPELWCGVLRRVVVLLGRRRPRRRSW